MNLEKFATKDYPLRASSIPLLMRCPLRAVLLFMRETQDSSGIAADTGSAVHKAVYEWHKSKDYKKAVAAMNKSLEEFPLADLSDAELHFRPYTKDPRNINAKVVLAEAEVATKVNGVYIVGHVDQIREDAQGNYRLFDVKTGQSEGWDMMHDYLYQVAAYCVAGSEALGNTVHPGALIRTRGYRKRGVDASTSPPGVFWNYTIDIDGCRTLLGSMACLVAAIRSGCVYPGPGKWCGHCPAGGYENCISTREGLTLCGKIG